MQPPDGGWTIAEVIDHLAKIETMVTGLFVKVVTTARERGLGEETDDAPMLEGFRGYRIHNRKVKVVAPERVVPARGASFADAWTALDKSRVVLLKVLDDADGFALGSVSYPHPNLGELSMYQWIAFVGFHETRHAEQIEEIDRALT